MSVVDKMVSVVGNWSQGQVKMVSEWKNGIGVSKNVLEVGKWSRGK